MFLSNENDILDCYIEFHAGAGGTESQDWAEMLDECIWNGLQKKIWVELIGHRETENGYKIFSNKNFRWLYLQF